MEQPEPWWDEVVLKKVLEKHGIQEHEIIEVISGRHTIEGDVGHSNRLALLGITDAGRLLTAVLGQDGYLITIRDMSASERARFYEETERED